LLLPASDSLTGPEKGISTSVTSTRATSSPRNHSGTRWSRIMGLGFLLILALSSSAPVNAETPKSCELCGKPFVGRFYHTLDRVTHAKVFLCDTCLSNSDNCFMCGLPAIIDPLKLPDGRVLCSRDAKKVVLDETKAKEIAEEVRDTLERLFSRFLSLPSTNVSISMADRVSLYQESVVSTTNFECPDVLGYTRSKRTPTGMTHSISIMSAQREPVFKATCAHEYAHAWLFEALSAARTRALDRDAVEGFCELVAWLLMDSLGEEEQKSKILRNNYTRGQIDLFIAAERTYGFSDILDWMRWGLNGHLREADLGDVRNIEIPARKTPNVPTDLSHLPNATEPPGPSTLILKSISSGRNQAFAIINNQTFAPGETAKVRVGSTNVLVRCLSIRKSSVRIQIPGSGKELELNLPSGK